MLCNRFLFWMIFGPDCEAAAAFFGNPVIDSSNFVFRPLGIPQNYEKFELMRDLGKKNGGGDCDISNEFR